ncbi:hypothetical protein KY349_00685 [Candidatus Woesearchaeota archaeon]|nr:hypothetical protein [Candidatus Woesearchaeota archaeon]
MGKAEIREALTAFGFSQKEVTVYLACLELGTATANDIANKADINRSTTYDILKAFLEKGIASKVVRKKTTHFEVGRPKKLIASLEEKKVKLQAVLTDLDAIYCATTEKPMVTVFEGKEGMKTILEDILATKKQTDVISTSKIFETFTFYFPRYIRQRKEAGIKARVIQEASSKTEKLKKSDATELRETRALPDFNMNSAIFIYGEKVAILKLVEKEPLGVLVSDRSIADDQRMIFESLWSAAR